MYPHGQCRLLVQRYHRADGELSKVGPTISRNHVAYAHYRGISLENDISHVKARTAVQSDCSVSAYHRDPDIYQQNTVPSQHPSRRESNASGRSPTTLHAALWPLGADNQLNTSGYVNQSPSFEQHHGSFPTDQLSSYCFSQPDLSQADPMDSFPSELHDQDRYTFQGSPAIFVQKPDSENIFPSEYPSCNQWDQSYPQDTGMT